ATAFACCLATGEFMRARWECEGCNRAVNAAPHRPLHPGASQFLCGEEVMGGQVVGRERPEGEPDRCACSAAVLGCGFQHRPVRVVLEQPTATGGETPPKLAGEDAYATSGGPRRISHSVLSALSKN